jgi:hypothetical protein
LSWHNLGTIPAFAWRDWGNPCKTWYPVFQPRFELSTSWIQVWSVTSLVTILAMEIRYYVYLSCCWTAYSFIIGSLQQG